MAICRDSQVINVALDGTLYQDIPSEYPTEIKHRQTGDKTIPSDDLKILPDTPLMKLVCKQRMTANTFHLQAKKLGKNLKAMATADDGIIEAVYFKR